MYSVNNVADYTIRYCLSRNRPISNLKLQKLLYFIWIDFYKRTKKYLFDEEFHAWKFGPVIPEIYYKYCFYGSFPILDTIEEENIIITDSDKEIINKTVEEYNNTPIGMMIEKTHKDNKPWAAVYNKKFGDDTISFDSIIRLEC